MQYLILALHYVSYAAWYVGIVLLCLGVFVFVYLAWEMFKMRTGRSDATGEGAAPFVFLFGFALSALGGIAMALGWALSSF